MATASRHARVTLEDLRCSYDLLQSAIQSRLEDFARVGREASDRELFEELVFCIFTAGSSARMGLRSVEAVREGLLEASAEELENALAGRHRYPKARAGYIVRTRAYLEQECGMRLRAKLNSFSDAQSLRDFFASNPGIVGIGYKEASHYLRNIGRRGYAILDKHVLACLVDLGVIDNPKPPHTRRGYLKVEERMKAFAQHIAVDFDELDLLLWSAKTGEILK